MGQTDSKSRKLLQGSRAFMLSANGGELEKGVKRRHSKKGRRHSRTPDGHADGEQDQEPPPATFPTRMVHPEKTDSDKAELVRSFLREMGPQGLVDALTSLTDGHSTGRSEPEGAEEEDEGQQANILLDSLRSQQATFIREIKLAVRRQQDICLRQLASTMQRHYEEFLLQLQRNMEDHSYSFGPSSPGTQTPNSPRYSTYSQVLPDVQMQRTLEERTSSFCSRSLDTHVPVSPRYSSHSEPSPRIPPCRRSRYASHSELPPEVFPSDSASMSCSLERMNYPSLVEPPSSERGSCPPPPNTPLHQGYFDDLDD